MKVVESYYNLVQDFWNFIEATEQAKIIAFNDRRIKLHDQILEITGLTRDDLFEITDEVFNYNNWVELYDAITKVWDRKKNA